MTWLCSITSIIIKHTWFAEALELSAQIGGESGLLYSNFNASWIRIFVDCQSTGAALINVINTRSLPVMWCDMHWWVEGGLYSPHHFKYAQSGLLTHSPTVNNYTLSGKRVTLELNSYFSCHCWVAYRAQKFLQSLKPRCFARTYAFP
jgi:hypothetical protein